MILQNLSIKRKLTLITMLTSSIALILSSVSFLIYDLVSFRHLLSQDLMTQQKKTLSPRCYTSPTERCLPTIFELTRRTQGFFRPICKKKAIVLKGDTWRSSRKSPSMGNTSEPYSYNPICANGVCAQSVMQIFSSYLCSSPVCSHSLSLRSCRV